MQIIDLFSGIGGFSLAGRWAGFETVIFCEIEKYCRKLLKKNFGDIYIHEDIKTLNEKILREKTGWNPLDTTIVVGGFP